MSLQFVRTTSVEHKAFWENKNGEKIFIKILGSNHQKKINEINGGIARVRTCLEILQGLAIPKFIDIRRNQIPKIHGSKKILYIAQSYAGSFSVHDIQLKPFELVGIWLFYLEQLAAFRRHKIIYTDFKCENILCEKNPLKVTIVDFDYAYPLVRGNKKILCHGFTPGFESPELIRGDDQTEQSLVYECALILLHFLTNTAHKKVHRPGQNVKKAIKILNNMHAEKLAEIFSMCLQSNILDRPKHYEDVLKKIKCKPLPKEIMKVWQHLRNPYIKKLKEIGL